MLYKHVHKHENVLANRIFQNFLSFLAPDANNMVLQRKLSSFDFNYVLRTILQRVTVLLFINRLISIMQLKQRTTIIF